MTQKEQEKERSFGKPRGAEWCGRMEGSGLMTDVAESEAYAGSVGIFEWLNVYIKMVKE